MTTIINFEDLEVWQEARHLALSVHELILNTGLKFDFALKDQIKRAVGSIMDNIAEGHGRGGRKEFVHFLSIANGSCAEVRSQLYRCKDFSYITEEDFQKLYKRFLHLSYRIKNLMSYLQRTEIKGFKFK